MAGIDTLYERIKESVAGKTVAQAFLFFIANKGMNFPDTNDQRKKTVLRVLCDMSLAETGYGDTGAHSESAPAVSDVRSVPVNKPGIDANMVKQMIADALAEIRKSGDGSVKKDDPAGWPTAEKSKG